MLFLALYIFASLFWRAHETLVKQPPGASSFNDMDFLYYHEVVWVGMGHVIWEI